MDTYKQIENTVKLGTITSDEGNYMATLVDSMINNRNIDDFVYRGGIIQFYTGYFYGIIKDFDRAKELSIILLDLDE